MLHYIKRYLFGIVIVVIGIFAFIMMDRKEDHNPELALTLNEEPIKEDNHTNERDSHEKDNKVIVDVKGAIKKPGVYTLNDDSRVNDIIELAGGFTEDADEKRVNLAERVHDEMLIYIPKNGEEITDLPTVTDMAQAKDTGDNIQINQATKEELETLNGIGPSKAEAIFQYIEENGPIQNVEELLHVNGIGEKTLDNFKEHIIIP